MILVGELDVAHRTWRGVWVDERRIVALVEIGPLVVNGNLLCSRGNFSEDGALAIGLRSHHLEELVQRVLRSFENVAFELLEAGLDGENLLEIVVFLADLFVQSVMDTPTEYVRIMGAFNFAPGVVRCGILAQQLDVLLSA